MRTSLRAARRAPRAPHCGRSTARSRHAVAAIQTALTQLRVKIEAWLDFPEEELRSTRPRNAKPRSMRCIRDLAALASDARSGAVLRDGLSVTIAGPPNAGKSSLLNRLAGYDAAIVTDIPGTTRDPLREHLSLDGLAVTHRRHRGLARIL